MYAIPLIPLESVPEKANSKIELTALSVRYVDLKPAADDGLAVPLFITHSAADPAVANKLESAAPPYKAALARIA